MGRCVLITGMSGTGKSSVIEALRRRGHRAVDMDEEGWSEYDDTGEWLWREDRLAPLLDGIDGDDVLFVSGCARNQWRFYPRFDHIVLCQCHKA